MENQENENNQNQTSEIQANQENQANQANQANQNQEKRKKTKKSIPENLKTLLVMALAFILIGGLFYILFGGEIPNISGPGPLPKDPKGAPGPGRLSECYELSSSCVDDTCDYLAFCRQEGEFEDCQVYDCGENYGIVITKKEEENPNKFIKTFSKNPITISPEQRSAIKENCKGTLEIIEQKCEGETFSIKVKVTTKGECEIHRFVAKTGENSYETFKMEKAKEENIYNLTLEKCLDEFELFAVGDLGFPIK